MSLARQIRVGKRRTITIPKSIAERLGIEEGTVLELRVEDNKIILVPVNDAITLSLRGEKFAKITLKELEEESIEQQRGYIDGES